MKKNSFVEGTIIASLAIIIVKVLGALYVIPFYSIIGEEGGSLYSYAYSIYSLFLNISTSGIPIAISKIISEYNVLGQHDNKEKTYNIGKKAIFMFSILCFFILFVFSREFAYIFKGNLTGGTTIDEISLVLKSVSFCLLVTPFLSVLRGYLQGHKYIETSSKSQVIEQIGRIAFILFGSYLVINILNKDISVGVATAVLGAAIGGLAAIIYLKSKWKKEVTDIAITGNNQQPLVDTKTLAKKIIRYCIPFIIVSVTVNVYSVTDLALVIRGLSHIGYSVAEAEIIASIISTWGVKICMIINAVATGVSISLMPFMSAGRVKKDRVEINKRFNQSLSVIFAITLPLAVGISILSEYVYIMFYGTSEYGGIILALLVFTSFFSSLDIVIDVALQGLNRFKIIYLCTISGFLTNAALDLPLIYLFDKIGIYPYYGAIVSTIIGYVISLSISLGCVKRQEKVDFSPLYQNIKKIVIPILSMTIFVIILKNIIPIPYNNRVMLTLTLAIIALLGGSLYFILLIKNKGLYYIFGEEFIENIINKIKCIFKKQK